MSQIETADVVLHGPTQEQWVVAYVRGDRLAWCGWPEGEAKLSDCTLVTKATDEARDKLLHEMAAMQGQDSRKVYAQYILAHRAKPERKDGWVDTTALSGLHELRQQGWMVAVHNDYRQNGELYTFWLFAKGQQCIKGEGRTDAEAIAEVLRALPAPPSAPENGGKG